MRTAAASAILLITVVCSLFASTPVTDTLTGKVIGVSDGDTIKVLVNKKQVTIRLEGIDAPEAKQSFGTKSKRPDESKACGICGG